MDRNLIYRISVAGYAESLTAIQGIRAEVLKAQKDTEASEVLSERARRRGLTDAEKVEREKTKLVAKESRAREQAEIAALRKQAQELAKGVKTFEKAEKDKTKIAEREAKSIEQAVWRAQQASAARQLQLAAQTQRTMHRQQMQSDRDAMFDRKRLYRSLGTGVVEGGAAGVRAVMGVGSRVVRGVAQGLGLNQAFDVGDIVSERMRVNKTLRALSIEARVVGKDFSFDEKGARSAIAKASRASGFSQDELVAALDEMSRKGQGTLGVPMLDRVAMEAKAIGTDPATVMKLRAQLMLSAGTQIDKKTGKPKEMGEGDLQTAISQIAFLGKTGVFRASELAGQSEQLMSRFAGSGGDFKTGLAKYVGFSNMAMEGTGRAAVAKTSINAIQDAMVKKEGKIRAQGIETREDDGSQRDFIDVVMDVIVKTGGRGKAFNEIIDPSRSGKAITTMLSAFTSAGGGRAGRTAMDAQLAAHMSGGKGATPAELTKDAEAAIGEGGEQLKIKMIEVRQKIAEALMPGLEKLATKLPWLVDKIVTAIDFFTNNPKLAMMTAIALPAAVGGAGTALRIGAGGAARWLGDRLAGNAGGVAGRAAGGLFGNAVAAATSTPVFVTNWPAGGLGGGGAGSGGASGVLTKAAPGVGFAGAEVAFVAIGGAIAAAILAALVAGDQRGTKDQEDKEEKLRRSMYGPRDVVLEGPPTKSQWDATQVADFLKSPRSTESVVVDSLFGSSATGDGSGDFLKRPESQKGDDGVSDFKDNMSDAAFSAALLAKALDAATVRAERFTEVGSPLKTPGR